MDPVLPRKRTYPKETDFSKCIICQSSEASDELNNLTSRGIMTFKDAMDRRRDDVYDRLFEAIQDSEKFLARKPQCHRKCRSTYTHKKELEQLVAKASKPSEISEGCSLPSSSASRSSTNFKLVCFLCDKERDCKGNRQLILVATQQRQDAVHQKAKELQDEQLLVKIQGHGKEMIDMIAADFRYHKSCMDNFMNTRVRDSDPSQHVTMAYDLAFNKLVSETADILLKDRSALYITQLRDRYREILQHSGVQNAMSYRTERLQKRILNHFGSAIQIVSQRGQASLVCSSEITVGEMCSIALKLQRELSESVLKTESDFSDDDLDTITADAYSSSVSYVTAKHLQQKMKDMAKRHKQNTDENRQDGAIVNLDQNRTDSMDISYVAACARVPDDLYNYLAWLMSDADAEVTDTGRVHLRPAMHERVLNVAQELMANVTNLPMPKHVGLALYVLKQTRSMDLVRILNRFGHSISYDDAQRYITTMANQVDQQTVADGVFIPSNLKQGGFVQCAFDNLDFSESTQDGSTLHATTHNIYQYQQNHVPNIGSVPLVKCRGKAQVEPQPFNPPESNVRLKDRQKSRLLHDVPLMAKELSDKAVNSLVEDTVIWMLCRRMASQEQLFDEDSLVPPTWSGFFDIMHNTSCPATTIGYGSVFPQSPTNPDVVQASLDYCISVTQKCGQETVIVTGDQAIYDIARGIVAKYPQKYACVVLRMGGFHIAENFLGTIGHFMKQSGIEDILSESGVCKLGTANKVMAGRDYYRMLRCHSLVAEAMMALMWNAFEAWLKEEEDSECIVELDEHISDLPDVLASKDSKKTIFACDRIKEILTNITPQWNNFGEQLGATGQFWQMHLHMVLILKRYIHAERAGLWTQHLEEVANMLPYTVSSGHYKYVACLPLYLNDMKQLQEKKPEVHQNFLAGNFTVHRKAGIFNGVWTDLALEQTYNNEGKTALLKGISLNPAAREKYVKTVPVLTEVSESIRSMANVAASKSSHHGDTKSQAKAELLLVGKIQDIVTKKMVNPFNCGNKDDLVNISTGVKASSTDLVHVRTKGIEAIHAAEEQGAGKISTPKLMTFASSQKTKSTSKQNVAKIYQDESAIMRTLCFLQDATEEIRQDAFSHEWTAYPCSLFEPDARLPQGYAMRKGTKAEFLRALLSEIEHVSVAFPLPVSPFPSVYLIDTMAFIQRFQHLGASDFGDLAKRYLNKILQTKPALCTCVNVVGDRYDLSDDTSLKSDERQRRDATSTAFEFVPVSNLGLPDWKMLMKNPKNKANLMNYMTAEFCDQADTLPDAFTLIMGGTFEDRATAVAATNTSVGPLNDLGCWSHEEADTRLIAHLAYCVQTLGYRRAVVHATDTDVILLCMYHFCTMDSLDKLWIEKNQAYLPIHEYVKELAAKLEKQPIDMMATLLCAYVLSGCDTVSYPYRRGKRTAAKAGMEMVGSIPHLASFPGADTVEVTHDIEDDARRLFVKLYGKASFDSLDTMREHQFAKSKADMRSLPPTEDAFSLHMLRSLYQIAMYKRAHLSDMNLPPATDFGRTVLNNKLVPIMMSKAPKPEAIKPVFCKCQKSRCLKKCPCAKANVPCMVACTCLGHNDKCGRVNSEGTSSDEDN